MENHLISVLIPFKNTADFLPECLDSILAQNYQNWEVIAVDDHSTDSSRSILDKYSSYDPRFRVYSNDGKGIISALRKAFSLSKGAFLTRMDSDDIMISNKLEIMVSSLEKYGEGHIAVGGVRYFSERGISNGYERYEK